MNISKLSEDLEIIRKLSDHPNDQDGLASDDLKAEFDKAAGVYESIVSEFPEEAES